MASALQMRCRHHRKSSEAFHQTHSRFR